MKNSSGEGSKAGQPMDISRFARDLIDSQTTMTLATTSCDGAWAAPLYYVLHHGGFYFFSSPDSRHIREALGSGLCAAAIHLSADDWEGIRGVQMSGTVMKTAAGVEAARALAKYLVKFPFCSQFFKAGMALKVEHFREKFRVDLYCFSPDSVHYTDNSISFGFRKEVSLPDLFG